MSAEQTPAASEDADRKSAGPLAGLLVADFSRVLAGPFATMLLGDLGAEVIKVERPGIGDDTRSWGPPFVNGESAYYLAVNRNKASVALDLKDQGDLAIARELCLAADILVENFRPGTLSRLGLGYSDLESDNPGLIYCTISGFGTTGPGAELAGYDFLVQAVGGLMSITGEEGGEPLKVGVAVVDVLTSLFATVGILSALEARHRSGRGQKVETNLLTSLLAALVNQASTFLTTGEVPRALGNRHPSITPYETLHAADRPLVVAVGTDRQFATFAGAIGAATLAEDGRFVTNAARVANRRELLALIEERLAERTAAAWVEELTACGIPCGLVNGIDEAFALARRLGLRPSLEIERSTGEESVAQVANPIGLSATPVSYRSAPPRLGEQALRLRERFGVRVTRSREAAAGDDVDVDS